jgi:AAA family ATPase
LEGILSNIAHTLNPLELESLSYKSAGFVLGDLILLVKEACLARKNTHQLTMADFESALCIVGPSPLRNSICDVPNVNWSDIAGLEETKLKLKESVEYPLKFPEKFLRLGLTPPKGVLLYGPPGCSKTLLAKAVASESNLNFMAIKGPEVFSKWVGDSEKAIQAVFKRARLSAPSVIFIVHLPSSLVICLTCLIG